ncbi:putative endopeptidase [Paenimyroides aquimaris]|uniref:Putative endopeptidase n=1 Tax=Paenimyroides marinum TaxID=1159016 RepID=A0A1H6M1S2_9FLAO|nr:M13 family metallopeptidase [Paenimyroides aquimaris]SEH95136.1 putative endopeptidase [Paenimyroides aquimaris]
MKKVTQLSLLAVLALVSCKKDKVETDDQPHGLALQYMDTTVKPGDDFYRYVNGIWFDQTEIPADKSSWGSFNELAKNTDLDVLNMLKEAAQDKNLKSNSDEGKAVNLYKTYLDTIKRSELGIKPIESDLAKINAIQNLTDVNNLVQSTIMQGGTGLFGTYISADALDSNKNVIYIYGTATGLGERDYYLLNDAETKEIRNKYEQHVARMLQAVGNNESDAKTKAAKILAFETKISEAELTRVELRDDRKTYNPMPVSQLQSIVSNIDWTAYFDKTGLKKIDSVVVSQPKAMANLNKLLTATPIEDLKAYLTWNLINGSASVLSPELEKANWEFYSKVLSGAQKQKPIEERGVDIVNRSLGEALGKLYVEKKFPAEAKTKAQEMISNIVKAYENRIKNLPWMAPATRQGALDKLSKLTIKIGYPDKWEDYSKLTIKSPAENGTYYDNMKAVTAWSIQKNFDDYGKPVDKTRWGMPPQMVNAYYNPAYNEIVFPAAILQPPFYDYKADEAVNYGGIGAVIGHEISHGFDDQGARYNADGNLVDWWQPADLAQFTKLGKSLAAQYSALQPFTGIYVDGDFTLGENIGDLGGITAAYDGLQIFLKEHPQDKIDGFTPEQRFFISWGTIWRTKSRDEYVKNQVKTDPHAPGIYRSYVPLQNLDAWYEAFNVQPENKLYLAPEKRVRIW